MRNWSPAAQAALLSGQVKPAYFVKIVFETETIYLWTGYGTINSAGPAYDPTSTFPYSQNFTGMGEFGQLTSVPESTDVVAQNITLSLSGIPVELITDAINAVRQNSSATLWFGFLDVNNNIIPDPEQVFAGHLDVPTVVEGSTTCAISITCENPLIDLNRAPNHRFTLEDQAIIYPGDAGFNQVGLMQGRYLGWPQFELLP